MTQENSPFAGTDPWDLVAEGYAAEAEWVMAPYARVAAARIDLAPTGRVLDVAAGPGTLTFEIASRVGSVHAVDFSRPMLDELSRRVARLGIDNVTWELADGQSLPLPDASYDAAFSLFGLMFFPDRGRGFSELHRVLRPGAWVAVTSWAPARDSSLMRVMFGAMTAADPSRAFPDPSPDSLENPTVLSRELGRAGFVDVEVFDHEHRMVIDDADAFWDSMVRASAPIQMLRRALGDERFREQSRVARQFVRDALERDGSALSTTARLGVGRRPEA